MSDFDFIRFLTTGARGTTIEEVRQENRLLRFLVHRDVAWMHEIDEEVAELAEVATRENRDLRKTLRLFAQRIRQRSPELEEELRGIALETSGYDPCSDEEEDESDV